MSVDPVQSSDIRALDQLLEDIRQLKTPQHMVALCEVVTQLRNLAPFNAMLIYMQRPNATMVYTAAEWRSFERYPKPDAHPLVILRAFWPVDFVFDIEDTDGKPLPEQLVLGNLGGDPFGAKGEISKASLADCVAHCGKLDIFVIERPEKIYKAGHIRRIGDTGFDLELNINHRPVQKFCTLCHELAHFFCGHLGEIRDFQISDYRPNHAEMEMEAELTANLVAKRYGVIPSSANYLRDFFDMRAKLKFSLEVVLVATGKVESVLNGTFRKRRRPSKPISIPSNPSMKL